MVLENEETKEIRGAVCVEGARKQEGGMNGGKR